MKSSFFILVPVHVNAVYEGVESALEAVVTLSKATNAVPTYVDLFWDFIESGGSGRSQDDDVLPCHLHHPPRRESPIADSIIELPTYQHPKRQHNFTRGLRATLGPILLLH